jgi:hypothetical protein
MSKARNTRIHAARRALERYGVDCSPDLIKALRRAIKRRLREGVCTDTCAILHQQHGPRPVFRVRHEGIDFKLVWDRKAKRIVTFLPPAMDLAWKQRRGAAA